MRHLKPFATTAFLLLLCAVMPKAVLSDGNTASAFLFHFTHASIWHLLSNFYVIAYFKPRWVNLPVAYVSATAAAIMLIPGASENTVGISGMIFAMFARRDVILGIHNWKLLLLNGLLAFIPCYNWKIHLLSYLIAYLIWKIYLNLIKN